MPGGWEWLIILVVLVALFGARRLPELARSVGQSARVFKGEMKGLRDDDEARNTGRQGSSAATPQTTQAAPQAPAQPAGVPPVDRQVNELPGAGQPGEPVRRDPVRPDTDR
jgi:sec-independent protein translocase protein TatA